MDCPKCGVTQDDGREECVSCGIVFARWEAAQVRRFTQPQVPIESPSEGITVSRGVVVVALILVVVFGVMWTKSRREARANRDLREEGMAMLDDINRKGNAERQRLEQEAKRAQKMAAAMSPDTQRPLPRPVGMEEADASRLIQQCSGFTERQSLKFPHEYSGYGDVSERYPALERALQLRILERGNDNKLWPGPGVGGITVFNRGEEYEIELGTRRVREITQLTGNVDHATARFRWAWEGRVAAETLLGGDDMYSGVAEFLKKDGAWRVVHATGHHLGGNVSAFCK